MNKASHDLAWPLAVLALIAVTVVLVARSPATTGNCSRALLATAGCSTSTPGATAAMDELTALNKAAGQ